ncbi:unannotated protein [freshwater metagenome]|uniref:Unannotated protein n=1 Tax=freshwater metagenome TaxID=449393 RepID=A0A6J7EVS0_9ZZZZ
MAGVALAAGGAQTRPMTDEAAVQDEDYAQVPSAGRDAELDEHWVELRGPVTMPPFYLPPAMPGRHSRRSKVLAVVLIAVFVLATAVGACLTYGPKLA